MDTKVDEVVETTIDDVVDVAEAPDDNNNQTQKPNGFAELEVLGKISFKNDPVKLASGHTKLTFGVVCNPYRGPNAEVLPVFVNCQAWDGIADVIHKHFEKGRRILVKGHYRIWEYTDADGSQKWYHYLLVREWYFTDSKRSSSPALDIPPADLRPF